MLSSQVSDVNSFGHSWVVSMDECDGAVDGPSDPCQEDPDALTTAKDACYGLKDLDGENIFSVLRPVKNYVFLHKHFTRV